MPKENRKTYYRPCEGNSFSRLRCTPGWKGEGRDWNGFGASGFRLGLPVLLLLVMLASCADAPLPRIRTFVGAMEHARAETDLPVGLNPLGSLKSCPPGERWSGATPRVVVSRPDLFSRAASEMIMALYQALEEEDDELKPVEMVLSPRAIENGSQAISEGRRCGAMVVLWEGDLLQALELALPNPDRIPLRALVPTRLCEFGNHGEQVNILYLTIMGLTATAKGKFQKANYYLTEAAGLDAHCLSPPPGLGNQKQGLPASR